MFKLNGEPSFLNGAKPATPTRPETGGQGRPAQKQLEPRHLSLLYLVMGVLLLLTAPAAMSSPKSQFNYLTLGANTIFALVLIGVASLDYRNNKAGGKIYSAYIMLVLGIITFLLYSHFYGTPWIENYHLYIFPISSSSSPFYVNYYGARNQMSSMSYMSGLIIILGSLYEITLLRKRR